MNRRKFFNTVSASLLFSQAVFERIEAATRQIIGVPPQEAAKIESFWREIQQSFSVSRSVINLNNAGVCASPRIVTEAVVGFTWEQEKVPSYTAFTTFPPRLETIRSKLARLFGCDANEIAIVRNTTEALQTVLLGVNLKKGDEVLTTKHDYWAMLDALEQRKKREGIVIKKVDVPIPPKKMDDLVEIFKKGITSKTRLILVSHPVNLTGQLFPIKRICEMAHARGIEVVVDGAQSFGMLDYKLEDLGGCDYFGTSFHKWLMGPKGTGMLYVSRNKIEKMWPLLPAPQKLHNDVRKFEAIGTQSATSLAIGEALAFHNGIGPKRKEERLRYLTHYWANRLSELPNVRFYTNFDTDMSCAIATVGIDNIEPQKLLEYLWDKHRIHVANPSARRKEINGIRVSVGLHTTLEELDKFCEVIENISKNRIPN